MANKPISALLELKKVQQQAQKALGKKYVDTVVPYMKMINAQMENDQETPDVFSALKALKENSYLYNKPGGPIIFAAAAVEIVEEKHFKDFKK